MSRLLHLPLTMLLLAACGPSSLINALSPASHYDRLENQPYGGGERQKLDIYLPRSSQTPSRLIIFFYGGAWESGSKDDYAFVASSLTDAGYAVIIPDYRLYPDVRFPAFVSDAARATAWSLENAGRFNIDRRCVFVMGHSAGAHIAALLALNPDYLGRHGIATRPFAGFIGLSGPYDFLPLESPRLEAIFPEPERQASQPVRFASADAPPTLLVHGGDDNTVYPGNSRRLAARLREAGAIAELKIYPGTGHRRVAAALAPSLKFTANTLDDALAFTDRISGNVCDPHTFE